MLNTRLVGPPSLGAGSCFQRASGSPSFSREQRRVFVGTVYLESPIQSCCVPDPRQVTARRGSGISPGICRLAWRDVVPFSRLIFRLGPCCLRRSDLSSQNGREHQSCNESNDRNGAALGHFQSLRQLDSELSTRTRAIRHGLNCLPLITIRLSCVARPAVDPAAPKRPTGTPLLAWMTSTIT